MRYDRSIALALLWIASGYAVAEQVLVTVTDHKERVVADAVVALYPEAVAPAAVSGSSAVVDQIDEQFVPYVSAVRVGTAVSFPNRDDIRHHVYSFSDAKKFELPLYKGTPAEPVVFDRAGVVVLGCNIHDWMLAYVYVLDTPWFAVTDETGRAELDSVPAGHYRLVVRHPRLRDDRVSAGTLEPAAAPVEIAVQLRLRPEFRRSRAPRAGDRDY